MIRRRALALAVLLAPLLAACGLDQRGLVLMTDPAYRAQVLVSSSDGMSVPDGLRWRDGTLFIADEGGSALRTWKASTGVQTVSAPGSGLRSPEDLAIDAAGNVYLSDDDAGGVWRFDPKGNAVLLASRDKGLPSTEAIALDPSGAILVGDGIRHQVFRVDPTGEVSVFLGPGYGIRKPESMVFDDAGNLYIADNEDQVLYLLTPEMTLSRVIEHRDGFSPETLWYSGGTLFITDSLAGKLYRYSPRDGLQTIALFGGVLAKVHGITTDDRGVIYVSIQTDLKGKVGFIVLLERDARP